MTSRSDLLRLLLPAALLCSAPFAAADAVVTFNEVNYNPASSQDAEWVEIHNQMAVNVDLSGWSMADGITYTFPKGTIIPGGGFLVVAKNPADPSLAGVSGVIGPFSGNLSNSGENIDLLSKSGRLMDSIEYTDGGDWPAAADGAGATLLKRLSGTVSNNARNWTASLKRGGNPGTVNFPVAGSSIHHVLADGASTWRFRDVVSGPGTGWNAVSFNDSSWSQGQPLFGTSTSEPLLTATTGLVQRYRASDITGVANGANPAIWGDTALDDGVAQDTAIGGNPTLRTGAAPSSQPVIRFDGGDGYRASEAPGISPSSGFVYFIVCKANAIPTSGGINNGSGSYIIDRVSTANENPLISLKAVNNCYGFQKRDDGGAGLGGPISTTPISTTQFQIVAIRRNLAEARYEIWVNGTMEDSVPDEGDNITPEPIVIGSHGSTASDSFNGDIAEVLVYSNSLGDADFMSAGAYLEARYGLVTNFPDSTVSTALTANSTSYFRKSFNFTGDPTRTQLLLNHTVADGAVFYLNSQEITRVNMPAGAVSHTTAAISDVSQPVASGFASVSSGGLVQGENVLAVSLHTSGAGSTSFFFAALAATETPFSEGSVPSLFLNEIAGSSDAAFFVEIGNRDSAPVSTAGFKVALAGGAEHALPAVSVPAGGVVSFTEAQLGFRPIAGDKVALLTPGSLIADAQAVATGVRGKSPSYPGQWLTPVSSTPGAANQFSFSSDVVINEICYGAPDLPAVPGTPATTVSQQLISYGSTWRYNASGASLASGWVGVNHPVGSGWQSGAGPLAYSNTTLPMATGTPLASPASNNPFIVTYYFETDFSLTAGNAANLSSLTFSHLIDDGAIIYLNGTELTRFNMPTGTVLPASFASQGVATAVVVGPVTVTVPAGVAVPGTNRISVEVHQNSSSSSDIVFGMQAAASIVTDPGTPSIPVRSSEQQWLELYNRGSSVVDLSGWRFSAGITYTFPSGTTLAPGGYLVISKVVGPLPANPGLTPLGPYSGSLSGKGERILLVDAVGNPVDDVTYSDGGRWAETADSGGTTLELRDPRSDNSIPEAWSASDESSRRSWQTYTYRGVASASAVGRDSQWRDFVFGLLDNGEMLIDNITVVENPDTNAVPMISGGNFESGTTGWRFLGNHRDASVVTDPDNASNHVLYLKATGPTEHMHNHVETTLTSGRSVVNGRTYEISFKARWLSGSNQLNTRLYFNRLAKITQLTRTQTLGTPGTANSTSISNAGPTFTHLSHSPVVPQPGQNVTITARAEDPDGLGVMTLSYAASSASLTTIPMVPAGDGKTFTAVVPGYSAATVVRFYVTGQDSAGSPASSFFPAEGPESHALYQVNDGLSAKNGLHNMRIVMAPADKALLYQTNNLMSNGRIGGTAIYDESEVYYDIGVRLKSSQRGRQNASRVGFNISFNDDQLFRGVHGTVAIDRSEGQITGAQEILYDHMMYASGGVPAEYNDLVKIIAPDPAHTSTAIMQMARFGSEFLDSQFDSGADGTVFEYELVYYPTTADANGYKLPQPDDVVGVGITSLGADKENYRWTYLIKNSEDTDDYSRIMAMTQLFDKSGAAFDAEVESVLDVDQWLRALAYSCASGATDSFFSNSQHNGQLYSRPSDGRVLYFPHDMDNGYSVNLPIFTSNELQKLTVNPARKRAYLGHLHDICTTVFNQSYMSAWTSHYGGLLPNESFSAHLSYINARSNFILSAIYSAAPDVNFEITTNGGADFATTDTPVVISGNGWINVRNIRLAGSTSPLGVTWTSGTSWEAVVPISAGVNVLNLEAVDFSGTVVGTDSITVTNSGTTQLPSAANLVVSEIYYNPLVTDDTSEFIELMNISGNSIVDLSGLAFTEGIGFTFPSGSTLAPGTRVVVVKNVAAFQTEFGNGRPVAGVFTGSLDNAGEVLTLKRADNTLVRTFAYSDDPPWPVIADTAGYSIVLVDPLSNPDHSNALNWRASTMPGGSPGGTDTLDYNTWKATYGNPADNADSDGDGLTTLAEYFLGGDPNVPNPGLAPLFQLQADGTLMLSITRRTDAGGMTLVPQTSTDMKSWIPSTSAAFVENVRIAGNPAVEKLSFRIPAPAGATRHFVRFAIR